MKHSVRIFIVPLLMVATCIVGLPRAGAQGLYNNAAVADVMLSYINQWGGNICRDAAKPQSGQCKQAANCAVSLASGGTQYPAGGDDYFGSFLAAGGVEVAQAAAVKGDVIQWGSGLTSHKHTAIVLENRGNGTFLVVDSNWGGTETVSTHLIADVEYIWADYTPPPRFARMGTVTLPPSDSDGDGVVDANDACPLTNGLGSPTGCPVMADATFSDFNGDGKTDVFHAGDGKWVVSYAGTSGWTQINSSAIAHDKLKLGDFNGDMKTDVFYASGAAWSVSYSGSGAWTTLANSSITYDKVKLGDFNGDGKTDVFYASAGKWYVSYSGTSAPTQINASSAPFDKLMLGDFNGDKKTDVFYASGSAWSVSYSGTSAWSQLSTSQTTYDRLKLGDFNGDGKTDVFYSGAGQWLVSYSGAGAWTQINSSDAASERIRLGDFNNDGKTDIFYSGNYTWYLSTSGTGAWTKVNTSTARFDTLNTGGAVSPPA